jgi:hypothetical protein
MTMENTKIRLAFEADVIESHIGSGSVERLLSGDYRDSDVDDHWQTWQTAWDAALATRSGE